MDLQEAINIIITMKEVTPQFVEELSIIKKEMYKNQNLIDSMMILGSETLLKLLLLDDLRLEITSTLMTAIEFGILIGQKQYSFDSIEELEKGKEK